LIFFAGDLWCNLSMPHEIRGKGCLQPSQRADIGTASPVLGVSKKVLDTWPFPGGAKILVSCTAWTIFGDNSRKTPVGPTYLHWPASMVGKQLVGVWRADTTKLPATMIGGSAMRKLFTAALIAPVVFGAMAASSSALADSSTGGCLMGSTESGQAVFRDICDYSIRVKFEAAGQTYNVSIQGNSYVSVKGLTGIISILDVSR
jgi:hypothetical protein